MRMRLFLDWQGRIIINNKVGRWSRTSRLRNRISVCPVYQQAYNPHPYPHPHFLFLYQGWVGMDIPTCLLLLSHHSLTEHHHPYRITAAHLPVKGITNLPIECLLSLLHHPTWTLTQAGEGDRYRVKNRCYSK
jgi:hypothetical protein